MIKIRLFSPFFGGKIKHETKDFFVIIKIERNLFTNYLIYVYMFKKFDRFRDIEFLNFFSILAGKIKHNNVYTSNKI